MKAMLWLSGLFLLLAGPVAAQAPGVPAACGINYNFPRLNPGGGAACATSDASATISGQALLPRWSEGAYRELARAQLRDMVAAGFHSVRFLVWYGRTQAAMPANGFDAEADRARAALAVREAVAMAHEAGMERVMVAFSPLGLVNPGCRRAEWGDCYRPELDGIGADFVAEAAASALQADPETIIDLQNEGCVMPTLQQPLAGQTQRYLTAVAHALAARLPSSARVTISAIMTRGMDCVRSALETVENAGFRRGPVSVHVYTPEGIALLPQAAEFARARGRELILGEAPLVPDGALARQFSATIAGLPPGVLGTIMLWPTDGQTRCAVNQAPPYTLPAGMPCAPRR